MCKGDFKDSNCWLVCILYASDARQMHSEAAVWAVGCGYGCAQLLHAMIDAVWIGSLKFSC